MCRIRLDPKSITAKIASVASGAVMTDADHVLSEKQKIPQTPLVEKRKHIKRRKNRICSAL
jgi:hypothetical protein